jgi:uncharacterized membrane protein YidH (DUF202 family)
VTLGLSLALDIRMDIVGQSAMSLLAWALLSYLLTRVERDLRFRLMACLVISTAGEIFLSLVWGLYSYRLGNIPLFVPPGHVLLLLLGLAMARHLPMVAAHAIIAAAGIYAIVAAAVGIDTLALPMLLVLGAATFAFPQQRRLYASTFVIALALELYGTWLGNWTWVREAPVIGLVTTNPPGLASALYCALDALVAAASLLTAPRWRASTVRP